MLKNKKLIQSIATLALIVGLIFILHSIKKPIDTPSSVGGSKEKVDSGELTELSNENNFPPSQRSIDGFFIGQHISVATNTLGKSDELINKEDRNIYSYWVDNGLNKTFLAFEVYNPESGTIGAIQLTGNKSEKETFLDLKLGDSREKVIETLGNPSEITTGTRESDLYRYNNRNYSIQISKEGKLFSIRIWGLDGFIKNPDIGDFIKDFSNALNTNNLEKISEFLMPDVEIYTEQEIFSVTKRFFDELSNLNSGIIKYLLYDKNSVKNILNKYSSEITMELRITEKGPSGYVYKFIESKILEEIFVVEHAGKYRIYEIKYRNSPYGAQKIQ